MLNYQRVTKATTFILHVSNLLLRYRSHLQVLNGIGEASLDLLGELARLTSGIIQQLRDIQRFIRGDHWLSLVIYGYLSCL